jgi:hypothetical protein
MGEILRRLQHQFDLFPAQNDWKLLLIPGQWDAFDGDLAMQRVGVKKSETANGLDIGRKRHSLLFDQVQLILPDLLGAEQFRRLAKVLGKLGDAADIGADGVG